MSALSRLAEYFVAPADQLSTRRGRAQPATPPAGTGALGLPPGTRSTGAAPAWLPPAHSAPLGSEGGDSVALPPCFRTAAVATRALVLGRRHATSGTAAAVAHELRALLKSPSAVLLVWGAHAPKSAAPASPAARLLVECLRALELPATPCGRLAVVTLSADAALARTEVERVWEAVADTPCVLAVSGPRPVELEPLVAGHDLVVVTSTPADAGVAQIAAWELTRRGPRVVTTAPLPSGPGRALARAGMVGASELRALVRDAVAAT